MSTESDGSDKRAYDARSRRRRAARERDDTRRRVLAAARELFLADGYGATKMTDIAAAAGVAIASVYRAGRSKAELIEMIFERDSFEDDSPSSTLTSHGRPQFPRIAAEIDPRRRVEMIADRIASVLDRVAPLWTVLRDAASVDPRAATTMTTLLVRRAASFEVAIELLPVDRLRTGPAESADTLWALSSPETYLMLRSIRGWSHDHYRDWLRRSLAVQLLLPDEPHGQSVH